MNDNLADDPTATASTQLRLFKASTDPDLPQDVRAAAASWAIAFEGLTVEIKRADKLVGWPAGRHGLDQSGQDGVAGAALAWYDRAPGDDRVAAVVRAIQDATIDTLARGRALSIVLTALERMGKPDAS
jgi:hypothetical protein